MFAKGPKWSIIGEFDSLKTIGMKSMNRTRNIINLLDFHPVESSVGASSSNRVLAFAHHFTWGERIVYGIILSLLPLEGGALDAAPWPKGERGARRLLPHGGKALHCCLLEYQAYSQTWQRYRGKPTLPSVE